MRRLREGTFVNFDKNFGNLFVVATTILLIISVLLGLTYTFFPSANVSVDDIGLCLGGALVMFVGAWFFKKNQTQVNEENANVPKWDSVKDGSVKDDPVLKERLIEVIQDISIQAWPLIYPVNSDSRTILSEFRHWGEEFERWWNTRPADWLDKHDYLEEVEAFTNRKCEEYLKNISHE